MTCCSDDVLLAQELLTAMIAAPEAAASQPRVRRGSVA